MRSTLQQIVPLMLALFLYALFTGVCVENTVAQSPFEIFDQDFRGRFKPNPPGVSIVITKQELTPEFFASLAKIPSLKELFFSDCTGSWPEIRLLRGCGNLTSIALVNCRGLDDTGMKSICEIPGLERFHIMLGEHKLTNAGLRELLQCKNLKEVELPDADMVITELQQKKPDLIVSRWYTERGERKRRRMIPWEKEPNPVHIPNDQLLPPRLPFDFPDTKP